MENKKDYLRITLTLDDETLQYVDVLSKNAKVTRSGYVRQLLVQKFKELKNEHSN